MKIQGARVLGPDFQFHEETVEVQQGFITALTSSTSQEASCDVVSYPGCIVIPGLIDVHMHGYYGKSCSSQNPEDLLAMSKALAKEGVTGFASGISASQDEKALGGIRAFVAAQKKQNQQAPEGAELLGLHMEGPFLNPVKKGAMREENIQLPSVSLLTQYVEAAEGQLRIMTMAPEMPGAQDVIQYGLTKGIHFSMGHTMATREEALRGADWGMTRATHTFNAMRPLDHRESGVLGVSLLDERIQCEMIADFVHLKPEICELIYRLKGPEKITLISDSCELAGLSQEQLPDNLQIVIKDAAYLPNGTLCGSTGTVMTAVRNMVSIGVPIEEAVRMASYNPACDLGLQDSVGSLAPGKKANFVVLDNNLTVKAVYIAGQVIR